MKKLTIVLVLLAILLTFTWLYRQPATISKSDQNFRQNLAGTWSATLDNMRLTNIVMPDGMFTCQLAFIHTDRVNRYQQTGTWVVQGGGLIETVKSDTNPTTPTPRSHVGKIIHADTNEFAVNWEGSPDVWVWEKISK